MTISALEPGIDALPSVTATLTYVAHMAEKPFNYTYGPPPGMPRTNAVSEDHAVRIRSLRALRPPPSLDREGFALVPHVSQVRNFYDEDELLRSYYPETEALVASATGAARVVVFDHTIRRRLWDGVDSVPGVPRNPVMRIHNDFTERSGPQRVRDLMGAEAEDLLRRRVAFINVWRPIVGPLLDHPLALCDAQSSGPADFLGSEQRYQDRTGEIHIVTYNPAHRWFYAPAMHTDETILIKCYDSRRDVARFVAHAAFADPTTPTDAPPRESIEIRTIAFFA